MSISESFQYTDGHVLIRPFLPDDALPLYEAVRESLAELSRWMSWCHSRYCLEESVDWIASRAEEWSKGSYYDFAIFGSGDPFFLGGCGLNQVNTSLGMANLGYWVRSTWTCQGVATRAARLVAQFAFNELGMDQIDIAAATSNRASQRVAEKLGAIREMVMRDRLIVRDKIHDAVVFSLTPKGLSKGELRSARDR